MFTKSTLLAIALGVTAICSATAPASAYLSLTPRTEAQEAVIANQIATASKTAEVKAPAAVEQEQSTDFAKSTEVTAFDDTSAPNPVDTSPVLASVTTRSL
jgi:hypothetical protein